MNQDSNPALRSERRPRIQTGESPRRIADRQHVFGEPNYITVSLAVDYSLSLEHSTQIQMRLDEFRPSRLNGIPKMAAGFGIAALWIIGVLYFGPDFTPIAMLLGLASGLLIGMGFTEWME